MSLQALYLYGDDGMDLSFGRLQSPVRSQSSLNLYGTEMVEERRCKTEPPLSLGFFEYLINIDIQKDYEVLFTPFGLFSTNH